MTGLCDIFDRYREFIGEFENAIRNKNYAKVNNLAEYSVYYNEIELGGKFKQKFEENVLKEIYLFGEDFDETILVILRDFKEMVFKLNLDVKNVNIRRF